MSLRRYGTLAVTVVSVASAVLLGAGPAAAAPTARYVDTMTVPDNLIPTPVRFGGLSGIDNLGGGNYVAVSDDPGRFGPARYFQFRLPVTRSGQFASATPQLTGGGTVLGPGNMPLLPGQMDMEGIRRQGGNLVVSSEGSRPFIRAVTPLGFYVRDYPIPAAYRPTPTSGVGVNSGFEGLAVTPGGSVAAMTETALRQDGPAPTKAAGTRSRLLINGPKGTSEFVYRTDALAPGTGPGASKGVSEILSINSTDFLVLERGFDPSKNRNDVKVFYTTTRGATNVNGAARLSGRESVMRKSPVYDFGMLPLLRPDNVEGMAWGPRLADGRRALILISDDNFNNPAQHTKLHLLAVRF